AQLIVLFETDSAAMIRRITFVTNAAMLLREEAASMKPYFRLYILTATEESNAFFAIALFALVCKKVGNH
ncbi:MAG TPA: hypothetical protein PLS33_09930, partial [Smithella sp.]|nr:hypothetical protein [Smithella sp.]HOS14839.1 hypothetical protein [Smithella sp.]HQL98449.1 hypothetical protein [Smithella sp.]